MPKCSLGSSRKYSHQAKAHTKLMPPRMIKESRQELTRINQATRGGVKKFPSRAKACVMPWANPRFEAGAQSDNARVAVGKVAPSPSPRTTRARISVVRLPASPVKMVAPAQIIPQKVKVRRAPKRSLNHPPETCRTR